jgi:hypothetical protein
MEPFKFLDPPLRLEYAEGVAMLKQAGNFCSFFNVSIYKYEDSILALQWSLVL